MTASFLLGFSSSVLLLAALFVAWFRADAAERVRRVETRGIWKNVH